jgi:hypothetical protein
MLELYIIRLRFFPAFSGLELPFWREYFQKGAVGIGELFFAPENYSSDGFLGNYLISFTRMRESA